MKEEDRQQAIECAEDFCRMPGQVQSKCIKVEEFDDSYRCRMRSEYGEEFTLLIDKETGDIHIN